MEDGGYGMFLGVKSYLDCRAEYFIKYNNKKFNARSGFLYEVRRKIKSKKEREEYFC